MKYQVPLLSKSTIVEGTMEFHFEKPSGFTYKAGQFIDVTLMNPEETDAEGNTRAFSLVSSPEEKELIVTSRMRDTAFKRVLKNAAPGLEIEIDGPVGSFTLHKNEDRTAIMLVGGIGITPFLSIIKDATRRNLPHKIILLYSNRRPEDSVYLRELQELAEQNINFTFVPTMTGVEESLLNWSGEVGYITNEMIGKYVPERADAIYYAAGPRAMVSTMREILHEVGVSDDDIRTEEFSGY